jgi:DNA-binding beta-propeller fold protein YncE
MMEGKGRMIRIGSAAAAFLPLLLAAAAPQAPRLAVEQRIAGPDGGWDLLSVDGDHRRLLVARADGVMAVDLATGVVTPRFVPGARLHAVLAVPGSGIGLATSGATNSAILFDTATGAVRAEVPTGANPDAAIYDPSRREVWVMNAKDGTASLIDPRSAKLVATVTIGGGLELPALDGRGHLFVNVEDRNQLAEIDLKTRQVVRRIALTGCDGPTGLAFLPSGYLLSACANKVATLVRAATGKLEGTLAIGARPDGAFYDPVRRRAYVPAGGDGILTVIDARGARPHVVATVPTQAGARTGTVDPATGRVYLPTARFTPPTEPGQRPKMVPGSFEILVVGGT